MKVIGINYSSRYIPTFIKYLKKNFDPLAEGEKFLMNQYANTICFENIQAILYGKDIEEKLDLCNYEAPNGKFKKMNLYECLMTISEDCYHTALELIHILFPQLVLWDIGRSTRRNTRNSDEICRVLKKFIRESEDKNAVYHEVERLIKIDHDPLFRDTNALLIGGHETISKAYCSVLYFLKKYPQHLKTIREELKEKLFENGKYTLDDAEKIFVPEKLDELEFMNMFLKETMRYNPAAARSLGYIAMQSFKINNCVVPKDQIVTFNIIGSHFHKDQWINPLEFRPERFDPSSEYFLTPSGQKRSPMAYCPFTFGTRTCPGRTFAMTEIKVLVIYFISKFEFEVDQETLDDPDVIFSLYSFYDLNVKITKVLS